MTVCSVMEEEDRDSGDETKYLYLGMTPANKEQHMQRKACSSMQVYVNSFFKSVE